LASRAPTRIFSPHRSDVRTNLFVPADTLKDLLSLFLFNALLVICDGIEGRLGTLTSGWERFMPWRTIEGGVVAPKGSLEMEVLLRGVFEKKRLLDLVRDFIVFEDSGRNIEKKLGGYHDRMPSVRVWIATRQRASNKRSMLGYGNATRR
jgi:type I site-specific restriction-modification system R (restriction) subunit